VATFRPIALPIKSPYSKCMPPKAAKVFAANTLRRHA
jgi:hypothetical protein